MKSIIFCIIFSVVGGSFGYGQESSAPNLPVDEKTGEVTFMEVVDLEGESQSALFKKAKSWFHSYYKNPHSVIQSADEEGGKIHGEHMFRLHRKIFDKKGNQISTKQEGTIKYDILILVKDGKYKFVIKDLFLYQSPKIYISEWLKDNGSDNSYNYDRLLQVDAFIKELIENLKGYMKATEDEDEDEW